MGANVGVIVFGLIVSAALYLTGSTSTFIPAVPMVPVVDSTLLLVGLGFGWLLLARAIRQETHALSVWLFLGAVLIVLLSFNVDWPIPYRLILLTAALVGLAQIRSSRIWVAMMVVVATVFIPWMVGGGYQSYFGLTPPGYLLVVAALSSASFIPLLLYVQRVRARPHTQLGPWVHFVAIGGVLILVAVVSYASGVAVARETIRLGTLQMATDRTMALKKVAETIEAEIDQFSQLTGGQNILDVTAELAAGGGFKVMVFNMPGPAEEDPKFLWGAFPNREIISPQLYSSEASRGERAVLNEYLANGIGISDPIWHTWGGPPVSKVIGDNDLVVVLTSAHPLWWGQAETDLFARRALDAFYVWIYLALLFPLALSLFVQAKREDALGRAGEEHERARVRQDVHDRVTNRLSALAVESETVAHTKDQAAQFNSGLSGVLRKVVEELQLISDGNRTGDGGGLTETVHRWSVDRAGELGLSLVSHIDEGLSGVELARGELQTVEAVLGEAIANVARHSGATDVSVTLRRTDGGMIELEVADEGKGFTVPADLGVLVEEGHLGLAGMDRRMKGIGGEAEIISSKGAGCRIVMRWSHE